MQPNPTVSEFTLNPEQPHNAQLCLARSRNRFQRVQRIYHPQNHMNLHPQELIVDVSLNSAVEGSEGQNSAGVRWHIDSCLNAIEAAYNEKRHTDNRANSENIAFGKDKTIHRIDTNLVMEYIHTICQDYKLRDRFSKEELQRARPASQQRQSYNMASPGSKRPWGQSLGPATKTRKKYLNLTQISRFDKSISLKRKDQRPTSPRTHHQTYSDNVTREVFGEEGVFGYGSNLNGKVNAKVEENFRYCINCQASILSRNVEFHQKHQCRNFSTLYKLNFSELTALVGDKILKMNKELKQKLEWLKQKDLSKSRSQQICNKTLQMIEQYANENNLDSSFDKASTDYLKIKESLSNEYNQAVKMTHKLHWFNQVYANLKTECSKRRESSRVMDLNGFVPILPIVQESKVVPQSPISQLYPHLHKRSMNPPKLTNLSA